LQSYGESRWRRPPSWISKIGSHFITIEPFGTSFSGNVKTLTKNATVAQKCIFRKLQDGGGKRVVNIECKLAGRKTANINDKNYFSLKHGVYRPDSTYKTAKMISQNFSH
jgi:hypothetical protein